MAGIKRVASTAVQEPTSAEYLIERLLSLPENEAVEAVYHLRSNGDVDAVADAIRKGIKLSDGSNGHTPSAEGEQLDVKGDLAIEQSFRYGITSGLSLVPTEDEFDVRKPVPGQPSTQLWTDVTTDSDFVHHLIKLYFTWINHCCPLVSEKDFYADFTNGNTEACSAILVNAICATGSLLTSDPRARRDPDDSSTAGDQFYQRARQLLFAEQVAPRLTTVQALQILSQREACSSRVSSGFRYAGWALNMAIELGMHFEGWKTGRKEDSMRRSSFWAMFNCDTAWSLCAGRVAMLPRAAIDIEKPNEATTVRQWQLYTDEQREATPTYMRVSHDQDALYQQSSLTELLSEMLVIFYAPRERLSSRRVLDLYARLQTWHKKLPSSLALTAQSAPNVFQLHLWYWTCINHLFRPIVRMKLVNSDVQPRQVCVDSAVQITTIMGMYKEHYPIHIVNQLWCHMLLTAGLTHLFDLPHKEQPTSKYSEANYRALRDVSQCLRDFATVSFSNTFAYRAIEILRGVAGKYGLCIAADVMAEMDRLLSKRDSGPEALRERFETWTGQKSLSPTATITQQLPPLKPEGNSMDSTANAHYYAQQAPAPQLTHPHPPQHALYSSPPHSQVQAPPPATQAQSHQQPTHPSVLFYTPIDGQMGGVPLYNNNTSPGSHMDLNVLLGAVNWPEQLRQDGFEISEVWNEGPMVCSFPCFLSMMKFFAPKTPV